MRAAEIENGPPFPSQRDNDHAVSVMPPDTQQEVTSKAGGAPVEVSVASGGCE